MRDTNFVWVVMVYHSVVSLFLYFSFTLRSSKEKILLRDHQRGKKNLVKVNGFELLYNIYVDQYFLGPFSTNG